jgi:hypothetical protein
MALTRRVPVFVNAIAEDDVVEEFGVIIREFHEV